MKNTNITLATPPAITPTDDGAMTVAQVLGQVALIQQILTATMKDGEHYGRIPGCGDKPTLLKAGAEKLCLTFRLAPSYEIHQQGLPDWHREYRITATLTSILTGQVVGSGVGICTTMEAKHRFRAGATEATDRPVPRSYWDLRQEDPKKAQELLGGKGFSPKKVDGQGWMIAKGGEKVENDNPADSYNTVLKMAKKRALVDAVLTCTAASDIFTQDLEDISANLAAHLPVVALPAAAEKPVEAVVVETAPAYETELAWDTLRNLMERDGIREGELMADLCARRVGSTGEPVCHPDDDLPTLPEARVRSIIALWPRLIAAIRAARK